MFAWLTSYWWPAVEIPEAPPLPSAVQGHTSVLRGPTETKQPTQTGPPVMVVTSEDLVQVLSRLRRSSPSPPKEHHPPRSVLLQELHQYFKKQKVHPIAEEGSGAEPTKL